MVREEHWFEVRVLILTSFDLDEVAVSSLDCARFCLFRRIHGTSDIWKRRRIASCIVKLQVWVSSHLELDRFLPLACVDNLKLRFGLLFLDLQRWCEWCIAAIAWTIWRRRGRIKAYFWRYLNLIVFNRFWANLQHFPLLSLILVLIIVSSRALVSIFYTWLRCSTFEMIRVQLLD